MRAQPFKHAAERPAVRGRPVVDQVAALHGVEQDSQARHGVAKVVRTAIARLFLAVEPGV